MQRPLPDNTQHSQEIDIHAPSGIQNRNPSKRVTTDPFLRPCSHYTGPYQSTAVNYFALCAWTQHFYVTSLLHAPFHNLEVQIKCQTTQQSGPEMQHHPIINALCKHLG